MTKGFQKLGSTILLTAFIAAAVPQVTYSSPSLIQSNINIPSDWAQGEVIEAKDLNLITESIQGKYKESITRKELCGLAIKLYKALGGNNISVRGNSPFTDTQDEDIVLANNISIVYGTGEGKFLPDNTATREEVSVMLFRTLKAARPGQDYIARNEYIFSDNNAISTWAKEAVYYMQAAQIINGVGDSRFDPQKETTCEEAIIFVKRIFQKSGSPPVVSQNPDRDEDTPSRGGQQSTVDKLRALIPKEMGKPYQWGGAGPSSFDCSGLVYYLYGKLGINLPRVAATQATVGTYVARENLAYGDLVFFARDGKNINHVGIYVGNGQFVHAPQTGDVVRTTTLISGYYARTYYTARKVLE